ncbi:hypothetical protein TNCV_2002261 [Trichonephila clavipes]|nr:hypothetical protein TNCV_2002261 [Trichonephila clavipes]
MVLISKKCKAAVQITHDVDKRCLFRVPNGFTYHIRCTVRLTISNVSRQLAFFSVPSSADLISFRALGTENLQAPFVTGGSKFITRKSGKFNLSGPFQAHGRTPQAPSG